MQQKTVIKIKFPQFSNNRFCFSDGITSLSLFHLYLNELNDYKEQKCQRIEKHFWQEKDKLLAKENKAQSMNERVSVYRQVLNSPVQLFPLS